MALGKWPDENAALASAGKALVLGGDRVLIGVNMTLDQWSRWVPQDTTRASLVIQLTSAGGLSIQKAGPAVPLSFSPLCTVYPSGGVYIGASPSDPGANNLMVQGLASAAGLAVMGDVGGAAGRVTITNATGIGNGAATGLTAPALGTGSGPASLQVATWIKVYVGTQVMWIPAFS